MGFLFSVLCFSMLDFLWIKVVMLPIYQSSLKDILLTDLNGALTIRTFPAFWAYAILLAALWHFVINPHQYDSARVILKQGFLLGFFLYGTYALTCWTLFKGFNAYLVIADMLWGGTIFATTSLLTCKVLNFLAR